MIKNFKKYCFLPISVGIFIVIAMVAFIFTGNRPVRNADKVLTILLNIPAKPIQSAYETIDTMIEHTVQNSQEPTVFSPDDTLIKNTYREMFGEMVSDTFIEDCISPRFGYPTRFHRQTADTGYIKNQPKRCFNL